LSESVNKSELHHYPQHSVVSWHLFSDKYISIFSPPCSSTRWVLIFRLQTVTEHYWSRACCHSNDN